MSQMGGRPSAMEEDSEMVLTDYDKIRKRHPLVRNRKIIMNTKILTTEFTCPICLDLLTTTMTTKECLHRFCSECISMALLRGNKECPTCRTKLVSKRSLRHDTNFDDLIKRIWPDRHKYDEMLFNANADGDDATSTLVTFADNLDDRKGSARYNRADRYSTSYDPFDKDAPTPPALLDQRNFLGSTSPIEMEMESGRKTPPWVKSGNIKYRRLPNRQKKMLMDAQKSYLLHKARRLKLRKAKVKKMKKMKVQLKKNKSKKKKKTRTPREPKSKMRKLNNGSARKVDAISIASSQDSETEFDLKLVEADLDRDDMEELDMVEPSTFTIDCVRRRKMVGKKKKNGKPPPIYSTEPSTSQSNGGDPYAFSVYDTNFDKYDPRYNDKPPYPETREVFDELMPNGKGATWQPPIEQPDQPQPEEENDNEEVVFDEEDVMSVVSIDDMLNELGKPIHENDAQEYFNLHKDKIFPDLSKDAVEDKNNAYMCEENRLFLREINELRLGNLAEIKTVLEETEQFDLGEKITWYSQIREGEEMIYYEKSKQPISRGRRRPTEVYNIQEEVARIGRRVTLKDIKDDMSNTDSEHNTPHSFSLASSKASSVLSLSEIASEDGKEEEKAPGGEVSSTTTATTVLPPLNPTVNKERLHRWLGEIPNHPSTPESVDHLDRRTTEEEDLEDCESLPENYEIEAELRPAAALLTRNVPKETVQTRFVRTQHTTTMEHLGEFLYQRWLEEVHSRTKQHDVAPDVPRPEHFYVFNRADRNCKCVLSHEPLATAQTLTARDDHVIIYYDTQRVYLSSQEMSLLEKIVPIKDRSEKTRSSAGSSSSS